MIYHILLLFSYGILCSGFALDIPVDTDRIQQQLGYIPRNFYGVSARTGSGSPIAIKTYPLLRKKGSEDQPLCLTSLSASPFPTHYWLTCPDISRAIGEVSDNGRTILWKTS